MASDLGPADRLDEADRRLILSAFAEPRGFYGAKRASELSGVPERTVYFWAITGTLVPDHSDNRPKAWSYRDLIFLRLIAFLRRHRVDLRDASALVARYRAEFASGGDVDTSISAAQGGYAFGDTMAVDALTGQQAFETMVSVCGHFDLLVSLDDRASAVHLKGPNLLRPSKRTSISPWVMSGEPVVLNSRITTATLLALHERRGLAPREIVDLYPTLSEKDVDDAIEMERDLRPAA